MLEIARMEQAEILSFWENVQDLFEQKCAEIDKLWQKRKRILDTKLLVVIILKMILSKNKQGYSSTLSELWESCIKQGIKLPQVNSIAASSTCEARQKLPEYTFKLLSNELITLWHKYRETPRWNSHRVFAIDGSKLNMPTGLLNYGYKISKDSKRHYPNGMMSCLYNLHEQVAYDFEVVAHNDERACAIQHLKKLEVGDLVIFDRGYFSYLMLHLVIEHNIHAVFRIQTGNVNGKIQAFVDSNKIDEIIEYIPSATVKSENKKRGYNIKIKPVTVRLIKYFIKGEKYICLTTLTDQIKYPVGCFMDLYHSRWGIEELYKVSKSFIDVEDFHSQTERTVKQELYGHLLLINIARIFASGANTMLPQLEHNDYHDPVEKSNQSTGNKFKINFKNCLATVGRHLENLVLMSKKLLSSWLHPTMKNVAKLRQKVRPSRSYLRRSFKPRNSWTAYGKANRA
jgi:Transposase DDE domain